MTYNEFTDILFAIDVVEVGMAAIYLFWVLNPKRYRVVTIRMGVESLLAAKAFRLAETQRQQADRKCCIKGGG